MFFTRPTVISGNVETSFHLDSSLPNESFMNLEVTQLSGILHKERCKVESHSLLNFTRFFERGVTTKYKIKSCRKIKQLQMC